MKIGNALKKISITTQIKNYILSRPDEVFDCRELKEIFGLAGISAFVNSAGSDGIAVKKFKIAKKQCFYGSQKAIDKFKRIYEKSKYAIEK